MLRTGARFSKKKDNNSAKKSNCLERERDFSVSKIRNFEDVHGSAIFENRGATSSVNPYSKTNFMWRASYLGIKNDVIKRRFFEDAPSESEIFLTI